MHITLASGRTAVVLELTEEVAAPGETFTTYNFEVAEFHTYHVGRLAGWVHNESFVCELVKSKFDDLIKAGKSIPEALDSVLDIVEKKALNPQQLAKHLDDIAEELAKHPGVGSKESAWDLIKNTSAAQRPGGFANVVAGLAPTNIPNIPGQWKKVNESMSARARAYQKQITGRSGQVFVVDGVKFDGVSNGVLIDAKGPGYASFVKNGQFRDWFSGADDLVKQAKKQLQVANGTPIRWNVAEADAVTAIRNPFSDNEIIGIEIIHIPAVP